MKILVFGADGQVGREAIAASPDSDVELVALRRADADLAVAGAARASILALRPDAVINAAAWTAVDKAEIEKLSTQRINADAVGEIAAACRDVGARLVHLSTDYVFDGASSRAPIDEAAPTDPLNVYGASKLRGEALALANAPDCVVIRTSWVYSAHGANFVKSMLRLAETRDEISVVADQTGGPTPASAIAAACLAIAARRDGPSGLYHFQGAPAASWAEFAAAIFETAKLNVRVKKIATREFPTPAKRPLFTVLDCGKIDRDYGLRQPDWRADLRVIIPQLLPTMRAGSQ